MMRFSKWKIFATLATTLIAFWICLPSLLPASARQSLASITPDWLMPGDIVLGLDLKGGAHLLFEVDRNDVTHTLVNQLRDDARRIAREEKVALTGGVGVGPRSVTLRVPNADDRQKIIPKLRTLFSTAADFGGSRSGVTVTESPEGQIQVTLTDAAIEAKVRRSVDQTIEVLNRRINGLGTTEPNIQREGVDRVLVEAPGLQDTQRLKDLVNATAKLEFRLVANGGENRADVETLDYANRAGKEQVEKQAIVQGEDLTDAQLGFDGQTGEPVVNFRFNLRGAQQFGRVTAENIGRPFAIVLDNKVISAPVIRSAITGGSGQISGNFTPQGAKDLAILLRAGALPAKLTIVEERSVGPGLGQDSIDAGRKAAIWAAILVSIYMFVTYGVFGLFANIALFIHITFIFAGLILLHATLTLPGISGIVLTIGMAVDSNVLIYERIREENHNGRSLLASLDAGFKRAFDTILDSNVTMFCVAAILGLLGAGPVRGFAISLGLGIITTIFTAVTMTQMMIALWYKYAKPKQLPI